MARLGQLNGLIIWGTALLFLAQCLSDGCAFPAKMWWKFGDGGERGRRPFIALALLKQRSLVARCFRTRSVKLCSQLQQALLCSLKLMRNGLARLAHKRLYFVGRGNLNYT